MLPFVVVGELRSSFAHGRRQAENERIPTISAEGRGPRHLRRRPDDSPLCVSFPPTPPTGHADSDQRYVARRSCAAAQPRAARTRQALRSLAANCPRVNGNPETLIRRLGTRYPAILSAYGLVQAGPQGTGVTSNSDRKTVAPPKARPDISSATANSALKLRTERHARGAAKAWSLLHTRRCNSTSWAHRIRRHDDTFS
jgi:hypothetical protein